MDKQERISLATWVAIVSLAGTIIYDRIVIGEQIGRLEAESEIYQKRLFGIDADLRDLSRDHRELEKSHYGHSH